MAKERILPFTNSKELYDLMKQRMKFIEEKYADTITGMLPATLLSCDSEKKEAEFRFRTIAWMRNPVDILHGGVTAAIMDKAMGSLTYCFAYEKLTPTIKLEITYLRPIKIGLDISVRCKITGQGKSIIHVAAEIWNDEAPDKLLATAVGLFFVTGDNQSSSSE